MGPTIKKVIVLGSGSAGLLTALALKKKHPDLQVTIVRSKTIPVIGVGEGATQPVTSFLHNFLEISTKDFFRIARPTWKLGIKFIWGPRGTFYYPFHDSANIRIKGIPRELGFYAGDDLNYIDPSSALMACGKVFIRDPNGFPHMPAQHFAYHFENESFVEFLQTVADQWGIGLVEETVVDVIHNETDVSALVLGNGQKESADLYCDCSGFESVLLGKRLKEPFIDFKSTLFCDRAVVGGWDRTNEPIAPYTTAQTMNAGWSWQIEHEKRINRGYVYCADFISDADAEKEFRQVNPRVGPTRIVKFKAGRYARTWVGNVVGIGNSAAFVEPLEATALGSICMQARMLAESLFESDRQLLPMHRDLYNERISRNVDSIRWFLSVHYKFNTQLDTPFWQHCRSSTDVSGAQKVIDYYKQVGPSTFWESSILDVYDFATMTGYLQLLVGQRVPHAMDAKLTPEQRAVFNQRLNQNRQAALAGFTVEQALEMLKHPAAVFH